MNCYKCATPIPDSSRFCLSCGADVSGEGHDHDKTLPVERDPELIAKLQADVGAEYVIDREIGRGGMAIVYLGHDASLGRKVAVKLLPPELTFGSSLSVVERFRREARTCAALDHPNIIPVYRVSQGQKLFWYVMKFLEGESLDYIVEREGQLAVDRAVDIIRQTADALDHAHQNQVIHRDVKPANIMVDARGRVTVTDFGIAKALDANTLTATGSMIGTPYFMSPEQCSGKRVGAASDQYSLAVMTYLMLGGHLPFTGDSVVEIIHKHVMDPVPPLGVLRPQLPESLVAAVERGLAKHPDERYASCAEFAAALDQAAKGLDVTAPLPQKPPQVQRTITAAVSPLPGTIRPAKGAWSRTLWVAVSLVGVAGAFGIGALITRGPSASANQAGEAPATPTVGGAARPASPAAGSRDATGQPTGDTAAPTRPQPTAPPASPPARTAAAPPTPRAPRPPAPQAATQQLATPASPPAAGTGFLTVGSRPQATITINGRAVSGNPVSDFEVQAGTVRITFTVTDSTGVWSVERSYAVAPGEHKRLGRIQLTHP